jgi:hypothetical protein
MISLIEKTIEGVTEDAPGRSDRAFVKKFKFAKIETEWVTVHIVLCKFRVLLLLLSGRGMHTLYLCC